MSDSSFLSLIALGGAALYGLNGAIYLAIKNHFLRINFLNSKCNRDSTSKDTHTSRFSAACAAVIFYCMVLFILIRGIFHNEIHIFLLNTAMILALLTSGYYALKMLFKFQIICVGCIRVHLANLMMSSAMFFYNFN